MLYAWGFPDYDHCSVVIAPSLERAVELLRDMRHTYMPLNRFRIVTVEGKTEVWELTVFRHAEKPWRNLTRYQPKRYSIDKEGVLF